MYTHATNNLSQLNVYNKDNNYNYKQYNPTTTALTINNNNNNTSQGTYTPVYSPKTSKTQNAIRAIY